GFLFRERLLSGVPGGHASVARLKATAYGSLAWTGKGHATDKALCLGLAGQRPDSLDPDVSEALFAQIHSEKTVTLNDGRAIGFDPATDVVFDYEITFEAHSNAMRFQAFDVQGAELANEVWYSVGGGFVVREGDSGADNAERPPVPFAYRSAEDLLAMGQASGKTIAEIALLNESTTRPELAVLADLDKIANVMFACIDRGLTQDGRLPGGLKVERRARKIMDSLQADRSRNLRSPNEVMDYVSVFAMAVNEENAAGGRVVTAPTNGAAGVVPAVLRYYRDFCDGDVNGLRTFLLAATAIGGIIKRNASISGAEVGCQGEVGSASAMAAAGLAAALGGSNEQVENAAEIAMEHHLGMTCDPIGGLVQIPCIERNAFGAIKAINAASLALRGDGTHFVSLDQVVETMRQTGLDMNTKYKETSQGGLAVNVTEC
ncbi:MAG: L-serine ammonia-lyase, partial [Asticcacaulis sp.]